MKKRIHVNQHNIKANRRMRNETLPVFTVKTYNANHKGLSVAIHGSSKLIYSPNKPLKCGAVAWIETDAVVTLDTGVIVE